LIPVAVLTVYGAYTGLPALESALKPAWFFPVYRVFFSQTGEIGGLAFDWAALSSYTWPEFPEEDR